MKDIHNATLRGLLRLLGVLGLIIYKFEGYTQQQGDKYEQHFGVLGLII
ncbi:MAG: hypothetical protein MJ197_10745 [Bacteroidales bacterium]|nr:hypothetical protein [Bacteroidales bacterium]